MKMHILGICGTFMGGIAAIARQLGHAVGGSDQNVYPPMSDQLAQLGIDIHPGYDADPLQDPELDQVIVGNVMTRGMPAVEYLLEQSVHYVSGPQWLGEQVLRDKRVFAVAGTHGKTTTASMLAWILEDCGINPGFLIGGVCHHFDQSARVTPGEAFVIEADEYDSAFFDKRSKFVHYHSDVVILNNLEYDHADIFKDLAAIQTQFHHLVRTIPANGQIVVNGDDDNLAAVLAMGCLTPVVTFGLDERSDYWLQTDPASPRTFSVHHASGELVSINWSITGRHNQLNALAAMLAARQAGVSLQDSAQSLSRFQNVKRRMELIGDVQGIHIYDDFAHHPTAIKTTLAGLQAVSSGRTIAVLEPRSNSMRAGVHAQALPEALSGCDQAYVMIYPAMDWDTTIKAELSAQCAVLSSVDDLLTRLRQDLQTGDHVVFMSNGSFRGCATQVVGIVEFMMQLTFMITDHEIDIDHIGLHQLAQHQAVHSVVINNHTEWVLLQQVFSLHVIETSLRNVGFKTVMKLQKAASSKLPNFDQLYEQWLELSQRENTMDEYGQLLFLGDSSFLQAKHIYVIEEKSVGDQ